MNNSPWSIRTHRHNVTSFVRSLGRDNRGQDLTEYALLISLITLALIAALTIIGNRIAAMFQAVSGAF